jgi:uncharacterized protein YacL
MKRISIEFIIALILSGYIIAISSYSPCPPLVNQPIGGLIAIICWIVVSFMFIRLRTIIAARLERFEKNILLILGFFTTIGQVIGGVLAYLLVETFRVYNSKPECVDDFSYCNIS